MKTLSVYLAGIMLVFASCTTAYQATSNDDDVYYSSKRKQPQQVKEEKHIVMVEDRNVTTPESDYEAEQSQPVENYTPDNSQLQESQPVTESYQDENGNNITNNYYYNTDDYYDYAYSARLRRFYSNYYYPSYYNDYYTNLYWYDYNPYSWGTSIYLGYNWWYPGSNYYWSYRPFYPYAYNNDFFWYQPWGYGNGYNWGYSQGYWNGYWDGYYNGSWYNPYIPYYNSYDYNSHYYGQRTDRSSTSGTTPGGGSGRRNDINFGERYEKALALEKDRNTQLNPRENKQKQGAEPKVSTTTRKNTIDNISTNSERQKPTIQDEQQNRFSNTNGKESTINTNERNKTAEPVLPGNRNTSIQKEKPNTERKANPIGGNTGRFSKPDENIIQNEKSRNTQPEIKPQSERLKKPTEVRQSDNRKPQPYSPPTYAKPGSRDEYTTPKYRNRLMPEQKPEENKQIRKEINQPAEKRTTDGQRKTYQPNNYTPSRPAPREAQQNYSQPVKKSSDNSSGNENKNHFTPSRSSSGNNSYTAPSRSSSNSGSYSAPSRSSGSSGSGSSGSGGRRR
ncbi:MAG: hypothetical protein M0R21_08995 [Lentimicrobiaceae bacterium]|jgi:hypothetical protein|nr:hypothetical protein [Lentimicrobiaceae bacterium]